jgi:uncharacterized protein (DUF58 family)
MSVALGVSAVNTGNNLIYLITAAFLSFLGVSGFFGKSNIARVAIELGVPAELYSNTEFLLKVRLTNQRRYLPSFLIRVRSGAVETVFPFVAAGASEERYLTRVAGQRGRHSIDSVIVSSAFPFNFFIRFRQLKTALEYIVFPTPKKCGLDDFLERERRARGDAASDRAGYEGDLLSLRNYAHGDPMKYIHWKASAKSRELKTKELSSLAQQPVVIDFEKTGIRNREERISCVTYLLLRLFRRNIPAGLRIGGRVFAPGTSAAHKIAMIRELALYGESHATT